jgi:hypothetical protein
VRSVSQPVHHAATFHPLRHRRQRNDHSESRRSTRVLMPLEDTPPAASPVIPSIPQQRLFKVTPAHSISSPIRDHFSPRLASTSVLETACPDHPNDCSIWVPQWFEWLLSQVHDSLVNVHTSSLTLPAVLTSIGYVHFNFALVFIALVCTIPTRVCKFRSKNESHGSTRNGTPSIGKNVTHRPQLAPRRNSSPEIGTGNE